MSLLIVRDRLPVRDVDDRGLFLRRGDTPELQGMVADEVGCSILHGSDVSIVGPLGPSDLAVVEPNDWASFRIWRTELDLGFSIRTQWRCSDFSIPSDDLPDDHIVAQQEMRDSANAGYRITCWRGGD
jgi:hypothetical protein